MRNFIVRNWNRRGISEDTRNHFRQIYNIMTGNLRLKYLHPGWHTSGSVRVVRIAFNLYTDGTPSVDDYESRDEQLKECREYSVSDVFCCGYAMYFCQGIRLRYKRMDKFTVEDRK